MGPRQQQSRSVKPDRRVTSAEQPAQLLLELFDAHGAALYELASAVLGTGDEAAAIVAEAITGSSPRTATAVMERAELAATVFTRCTARLRGGQGVRSRTSEGSPFLVRDTSPWTRHLAGLSPDERAALSLAWFGSRDYVWVGHVMDIEPTEAAQLLRSGLLRLTA